jgi:hypothetical protein
VEASGELSGSEVDELVATHTARIAEAVPDGRTSVSGSTLLGGYGGHDVDLVVLVPNAAVAAERLRGVYPPLYEDEWREDWAAFRVDGPPQVDIVVTAEGTKGDAQHRRAWELLLADQGLRAEYQALKAEGMDSVTKAAFFERVVERLPPER